MLELNAQKESLVMDEDTNKSALSREERQRTGRYIAVGAAIFLSLLGLYQAVARGTPQYAALFAPALIMFIYILWILYASKNQRKAAKAKTDPDSMVEIAMDYPSTTQPQHTTEHERQFQKDSTKETPCVFSRSYSIA